MASKIQSHNFYVAITPYKVQGVEDQYNELSVFTSYNEHVHQFYVSLHAGWKSTFGHGSMIMGDSNPLTASTRVYVKESPRNSQKTINEIGASLELAKDIIAALFDDREWGKLKAVVQNAARFGYTDGFKEQAEKYLAARKPKATEPVVKQVDVMGLMGALQTKGEAKLSDFAKPIESESNEKENNSNQETMAQNVKAADLIGKTIVVGDNQATIVIKSVDGDKLSGEFTKDGKTTPMSFPISQLHGMTEKGLWKLTDSTEATDVTTEADVQEVQDIVPVVTPRKPEPKAEEPAAKVEPIKATVKPEPKPKAKDVKPETKGGKYAYATYQTKKGKTGAKITGFASEDDVFYAMAADIHASGSYERDKQGNKHYYLCFGPRYAEAAKSICKVLNSDKTVNQKAEECKLIVSQATEELATKREEWKQKREERKAQAENKPKAEKPAKGEKTYTQTELAEWLRKLNAGDPEAAKFFNDLAKAA